MITQDRSRKSEDGSKEVELITSDFFHQTSDQTPDFGLRTSDL